MHIVKYVRQYYASFHNGDVPITNTDIAKAMGTHQHPDFGAECIIEEAQMALYKCYLQHTGLSPEAASKAASSSFPTPQSYNDLILWQSLKPPKAQPQCKHVRHPADQTQIFARHCPECMFSIHCKFLDIVSSELAAERDICLTDRKRLASVDSRYHRIKTAWVYARATLANFVRLLDLLAAQEHLWEARHSRGIIPETKSATKALDVAASSSYNFLKTHNETTPNLNRSVGILPKAMPKATKKVTFAGNYNQPVSSRSRQTYCRSDKAYKPGKHTCPRHSEWLNTSALHEWGALIAQCKLFIEESTDTEEDDSASLLQQGFVWEYKYRKDVMRFLSERASSYNKTKRAQYLERLHSCDAVIVVKPHMVKFCNRANFEVEAATFEDVELAVMEKESFTQSETVFSNLRLDDKQDSAEAEVVASSLSSNTFELTEEEKEGVREWLSFAASLKEGL